MMHPLHGNELHINEKSINQALEWYNVKVHRKTGSLKCKNCAKSSFLVDSIVFWEMGEQYIFQKRRCLCNLSSYESYMIR